jgi:hypothetical protein
MATDATFATNIDLSLNELRNARFQALATPPSPSEARVYYDTVLKKLRYYDGSGWVNAEQVGFGAITSPAVFGQANANGSASTAARSDHSHALPSHDDGAHAAVKLSALAAPAANVPMAGYKLTGLGAATANGDAVRWEQVNGVYLPLGGGSISGLLTLLADLIVEDELVIRGSGNPANGGGGSIRAGGSTYTLVLKPRNGDATYADAAELYYDAVAQRWVVESALRVENPLVVTNTLTVAGKVMGVATGTAATDAVNKSQLDAVSTVASNALPKAGGTMSGAIAMGGNKITGLADGTAASDAVSKQQLDAAVTAAQMGLNVKASARVYSTGIGIGTYNSTGGASGRGQITAAPNTMDGVTLVAGDRILVGSGSTSGIWSVTTVGTGSNGVWDRATDFDSDAEVTANAFVFIAEGTTYADTGWVLTTNNPITIGGASGTSLTWSQFSGPGSIVAGQGLFQSGNAISVGDGLGISCTADTVAIDTAVVARKYSATLSTSATSYTVTHNLGTRDVQVTVRQNSSPYGMVITAWEATDANTVTVYFATAPAANTYRVTVIG